MSKIEISHGCAHLCEPYVPQVCRVAKIESQTRDVKSIRLQTLDGARPFDVLPGQLGMLSVPPFGECMFAVTSFGDDYVEMAVKRVGFVTERIHELSEGDQVGLRGPYGNWFPYESCRGRDMLFVSGGIGSAPVRSFIRYCLEHRDDYGRIDIVYSASSKADLVYLDELTNDWPNHHDTHVHVSVYHGSDDWEMAVVHRAVSRADIPGKRPFDGKPRGGAVRARRAACSARAARRLRAWACFLGHHHHARGAMKCGVGKCGRCNIGGHFICLDGPCSPKRSWPPSRAISDDASSKRLAGRRAAAGRINQRGSAAFFSSTDVRRCEKPFRAGGGAFAARRRGSRREAPRRPVEYAGRGVKPRLFSHEALRVVASRGSRACFLNRT